MRVGLTYAQTLDIPIGELRDLIAIEQIKYEGVKQKHIFVDDDIIPDVR